MQALPLTLALAVAATLAAGAAAAQGVHTENCDSVPKEEWRPQAELERMLINKGWKITRVKIANGCFEVYARDAKNDKKEIFFHPKTLQVVVVPKRDEAPR
jgi:hypothetical protein